MTTNDAISEATGDRQAPVGETAASGRAAERAPNVSPELAALVGLLAVALWNAVSIAELPLPQHGGRTRIIHHAVDLGHTLAIGILVAAGVALWRRFGPRHWAARYALVASISIALGELILPEDLGGFVEQLGGDSEGGLLLRSFAAAVALSLAFAFAIGQKLARPKLRWVAVALGCGFIVGNTSILKSGYAGAHALVAANGATLIGAALAGARWPARLGLAFDERALRLSVWGVAALATAGALASIVWRPPSAVQTEFLQRDTALLVPWLHPFHGPASVGETPIPAELRRWFESRVGRRDVPPSPQRLLPKNAIVVLVTIDALRADLMQTEHRTDLPNLHELRKTSLYFAQARSAGADTRLSLGALLTGRYYSMLKWTHPLGKRPTLEADKLPRLPEVLQKHGIPSLHFIAVAGLLGNRIGIARGFSEELFVRDEKREDEFQARELVTHAIERLRSHGGGPLFVYMHLIEPHAPYYPHGKPTKSKWDTYLQEVSYVDAQVARLERVLQEPAFEKRAALIVSSDHGEGFGEKGVYNHNKTVYDIMVHVPLFIQAARVSAREVDQNVSLIDVGPTIFDLFGVPTPGFWMGESLLPFMTGGHADPNRLMLMETRFEHGMFFPDRMKAIVRWRAGAEEVYDLKQDPEELHNVRDTLGAEADRRLGLLRAFLQVHAGRRQNGEEF